MQLNDYTDFINAAHAMGWKFTGGVGDYDIWETAELFFYIVNINTGAIEKSAIDISAACLYANQMDKGTLQ